MKRPKGKLMALLAVFAAIGLVTATGAFTSVQAQRTAQVNVAGDNSALLALTENTSQVTGVVSTPGSTVELNFNDGNSGASGINENATTRFKYVLDITNQGNSQVPLTVSLTDESGDEPNSNSVETPSTFVNVTVAWQSNGDGVVKNLQSGNTATLSAGETVTITITFDTTADSASITGDDILDQITFNAG